MSWTPARVKSFIISALRAATRKWPPKYTTLNEAKTEKKVNVRTGRMAQHYRCNLCSGEYPATGVQVDHRQPVVDPETGFQTWDIYIERLFCGPENLQVLCTECHIAKTTLEKEVKKCSSKKLLPSQEEAPLSSKEKSRKRSTNTSSKKG